MLISIDSTVLAHLCPTYVITDEAGTVAELGPSIKTVLPEISEGSNIQQSLRSTSIASNNWLSAIKAEANLKFTSLCGELHLNAQIFRNDSFIILLLGADYSAIEGTRDRARVISDHGPLSGPLAMMVKLNQITMMESHRLAQQLDNARKRSRSIHNHLATMSSIVAHDFNNFLALISLNASRLIRKAQLSQEDRSSVQKIILAAKRAGRLSEDLREICLPKRLGNEAIDIDNFLGRNERVMLCPPMVYCAFSHVWTQVASRVTASENVTRLKSRSRIMAAASLAICCETFSSPLCQPKKMGAGLG